MPRPAWTQDEIDDAEMMLANGKTYTEIGVVLHRTETAVGKVIRKSAWGKALIKAREYTKVSLEPTGSKWPRAINSWPKRFIRDKPFHNMKRVA